MSAPSKLRYYYLTWLSQPAADRPLYQTLNSREISSVVEIGIGQGVRTQRMFEVALKPIHDEQPLRYAGIDLFEARGKGQAGLSLKEAYAQLKTARVKLQLVPGDPLSALARAANTLAGTDVVIISHEVCAESLSQAWRYLPRMIHKNSLVYWERPTKKAGETKFQLLTPLDVARLAQESQRSVRRAA